MKNWQANLGLKFWSLSTKASFWGAFSFVVAGKFINNASLVVLSFTKGMFSSDVFCLNGMG